MVVFTRLNFLGKPLILCATTGFLWAKLNNDNDLQREKLKSTINQVDLICQAYKERNGIPGVSIGVTMHGSTVWKQGFGLADIEQQVACTPDTVMRIASISKVFTITIAAQLVEKGKLTWDDTIDKHHPDLPKFLYENLPVTITIRQLASHTSGIRHYWKKDQPKADNEFVLPEYYLTRSYPTVSEALSIFLNDELLHSPGTTWLYTTHGYTLLSAVLERVLGEKQTFTQLLEDLVVQQLGLRYTKLEYPHELVHNRSRYYCRRTANGSVSNVPYVDLSYKWAGGGMISNIYDLLIFANTLLQCRQRKLATAQSSNQLLKAETVSELWSPVAQTSKKGVAYGLGWMIAKEQVSSVKESTIPEHIFHTGGAIGATSILLLIPCSNHCSDPRCGICIVILTNLENAGDIYHAALDIALLFRQISPCASQFQL